MRETKLIELLIRMIKITNDILYTTVLKGIFFSYKLIFNQYKASRHKFTSNYLLNGTTFFNRNIVI